MADESLPNVAAPVEGGPSLPPSTAVPFIKLDPKQLEFLEQKKMVSPDVLKAYRARMATIDPKYGLAQTQGRGLPIPAGQPGAVQPKPAAKPSGPEDIFISLVNALEWRDPRQEGFVTMAGYPGHAVSKIPKEYRKLAEGLAPAPGMVPVGWRNIEALTQQQKALLAQLITLGTAEQEKK